MEDHFSWSDSMRAAFSSCLPCLRSSPESDSWAQNDSSSSNTFGGTRGIRRARSNELEGLLADAGDTDTEAETVSLHSNIGAGERRRRKKKGLKTITIFGWNLFGKPPIQLPDDDEEDLRRQRPRRKPTSASGTLSSSTLDSDAAPLDLAAIDQLQISSAQLDERTAAAEAEDKRLKEERRQLRKERKELQKAAKAIALAAEGGLGSEGEFQGFPGSGPSTYRHIPSPFQEAAKIPPPAQPPRSGTKDSFGGIASFFTSEPATADPDSDDADLGGQLYARRTTSGNSNGSDSRSRTSASQSNPDQSARYNHHYLNPLPSPHLVPLPRSSRSDSISSPNEYQQPRKKKTSKSRSSASHSSKTSLSSTSQSPSLASPIHTSFPASPTVALPHSPLSLSAPREEFEGFPMDSSEGLGFPSAGFGGGRSKGREMGAFLADRGDA